MTRFLTIFLTLGLLAMPTLGWAESRKAAKAERADIREIYQLIDHISLKQTDARNKQSFFNLLELKEEAYENIPEPVDLPKGIQLPQPPATH